jgi:hypothetical protein
VGVVIVIWSNHAALVTATKKEREKKEKKGKKRGGEQSERRKYFLKKWRIRWAGTISSAVRRLQDYRKIGWKLCERNTSTKKKLANKG